MYWNFSFSDWKIILLNEIGVLSNEQCWFFIENKIKFLKLSMPLVGLEFIVYSTISTNILMNSTNNIHFVCTGPVGNIMYCTRRSDVLRVEENLTLFIIHCKGTIINFKKFNRQTDNVTNTRQNSTGVYPPPVWDGIPMSLWGY